MTFRLKVVEVGKLQSEKLKEIKIFFFSSLMRYFDGNFRRIHACDNFVGTQTNYLII